jgi:hypothetical protein
LAEKLLYWENGITFAVRGQQARKCRESFMSFLRRFLGDVVLSGKAFYETERFVVLLLRFFYIK